MCEFVWCEMICQRRPNSLYDGHARLVDTGLPCYVRALHQSEPEWEKQLPHSVSPCHDPAGLSILKQLKSNIPSYCPERSKKFGASFTNMSLLFISADIKDFLLYHYQSMQDIRDRKYY